MKVSHLKSKCGKLLCLTLVLALMVGIFPMGAVSAGAEDGIETTETAETPEPEVTPVANEENEEQETDPTPSAEPEESTEPENTVYDNSISGMLWYDENDDGIKDSGEQPVADYPVYLYAKGNTSSAVQTATTDAIGRYSFSNIEPGSYVVGVKSNELGTDYYLLPVVGATGDNKLGTWSDEWDEKYSGAVTIAEDTVITGINAGMRTPPGIQPMLATSYTTKIVHGKLVDGVGNPLAYTNLYLVYAQHTINGTGVTTTYLLELLTTDANGYFYFNSGSLTYSSGTALSTFYGSMMCIAFPNTLGITSVIGSDVAVSESTNLRTTPDVYNGALASGGAYTPAISGYTLFRYGYHSLNGGVTSSVTYGTASSPCVFQIGQAHTVTENYYLTGTTTQIQSATGTGILPGNTYTKTPGNITVSGTTYTYDGRLIDTTSGTPSTTVPVTISNVTAAHTVNYYYYRNIAVSFNTNGGSTAPSTTSYRHSATFSPPTSPTKTGYIFAGWYTAASAGTQVTSTSVVGNIFTTGNTGTLYAHWVKSDTSAATNITNNSATLNGTYFTQGISGNVYYQYGTTTSYGSTVTYNSATSVTTDTSAATSLTGLTAGTTYHYRLVTVVGGYTVYGSDMSFTTLPPAPIAVTGAASGITTTGVTIAGTYNTNGGTLDLGRIWFSSTDSVLSTAPGTVRNWFTASDYTQTGNNGTVSTALSGLTPNTTYYYRNVVRTSESGEYGYGSVLSFKTLPSAPTATATAPTSLTSSSATLNGNFNTMGVDLTTGWAFGQIWWGTDSTTGVNGELTNTLGTYGFRGAGDYSPSSLGTTGNTGGVAAAAWYNITGLTPSTTYYYQVYIQTTGGTVYSNVISFTTPAANHTVTKIFIDETGISFQANGTASVPISSPNYTSSVTNGPVSVSPDIYLYQGYAVGSYTPGVTTLTTGVPTGMALTGNTTIYFVYHRLDSTTITVTYPTSPMEFYVDGNTWPNIETGAYGTTGTYYTITNGSECALQVNFKKMAVTNNDGLNFVPNASGSLPGSHDISIDLNAAPASVLGGLPNGFTAGLSNIDQTITYSGQTLGTLDGTYIHPAGALSEHGYITIGGYFADYLTGAGKYPILKFTFEFTLQTS